MAVFTLVAVLPTAAFAARGRPFVDKKNSPFIGITYATFVSDTGSLLRGPRWSTDVNKDCPMPSPSEVTNLRSYGFNALHLYGESWALGEDVGYCKNAIQELVSWTRDAGMYLVLTIGNAPDGNGEYDPVKNSSVVSRPRSWC